jgi:hypothetical protein
LGRIRKHSTSDASRTAITVNGISAIRSPNRPPTATRPKNAITVVIVAENTGLNIARAARSAASTPRSPNRRVRKSACSPTTMASSTTIPSVMINAKIEIMFSVRPAAYITAIAASIDTGMPIATQSAVRAFRNRNKSARTSARPCAPFSSNNRKRLEICSARAENSDTVTPSGRVDCTCAATS